MTEPTKESLDALIDGLEGKITAPDEYSPEWISGFRIGEQALADAILASQPERCSCGGSGLGHLKSDTHETSYRPESERVECPTNCTAFSYDVPARDVSWREFFANAAIRRSIEEVSQLRCPDCGQSLKGAGE